MSPRTPVAAAPPIPLGREVAYPRHYDPGLLFPIARTLGRAGIGIGAALPFIGHDRWHAYELGWLDARGKPWARERIAPFKCPRSVDVIDALLSKRSYKEAWSVEAVREYILAQSGKQFDPVLCEASLDLLDVFASLHIHIPDEPL